MRMAEFFRPDDVDARRLLRQVGVESAVLRLPEADTGTRVDLERLRRLCAEFEADGLPVEVLEPLVPRFEGMKQGLPQRDAELLEVRRVIEAMGELGIRVLCYNFMAVRGWTRTVVEERTRGGAMVTGFDVAALAGAEPDADPPITETRLWDAYRWFLDHVLPIAEDAGVTLALHPDDPPVSPLRGVARIMRTPDALDRVLALADSPHHALTFCQGTIATMGADVPETIRRLGPRSAFVHFRDITGAPERFTETFVDDGQTDMRAAMQAWVEVGFDGPVRTDHVPTLYGESNDRAGYAVQGRLHAIGYIQGLHEAASARSAS